MQFSLNYYASLLEEKGLVIKKDLKDAGEEPVSSLTYDSREAKSGTLFVCKGEAFKKEYLEKALGCGSICYVSETDYGLDVPRIIVSDIRQAMPHLAKAFYDIHEGALTIIGITGTKGKTTTAWYTRKLLDDYLLSKGEKPCAFISTVETFDGKETIESGITTPEIFEGYRHLRNAYDSGLKFVVMEVSSQALKYNRVTGITFDIAVLLNISEDHISPKEHPNFADYFNTKLSIYDQCVTALVNSECVYREGIFEAAKMKNRVLSCGWSRPSDFQARDIKEKEGKIYFTLHAEYSDHEMCLGMRGLFNLENALVAIAIARQCGVSFESIKTSLENVSVPGRVEEYYGRNGDLICVVDYAHNGLSFEKILTMARTNWPDHRVVTVFGCPGNKAYNRRKDLGTAAARFSDYIYLTADDPAKEKLADICAEVGKYIEMKGCPYEVIEDREQAIKKAIETADGPTAVMILGKGCEHTQIEENGKVPYISDAEAVKKYLYSDGSEKC